MPKYLVLLLIAGVSYYESKNENKTYKLINYPSHESRSQTLLSLLESEYVKIFDNTSTTITIYHGEVMRVEDCNRSIIRCVQYIQDIDLWPYRLQAINNSSPAVFSAV